METSTRIIFHALSICDFVLSITTSNVVWRDKNVKTRINSDNDIKGTSKHAMRVHGMLGKETNLNLGGAL